MKQVKLSNRLKALADLIDTGASIIDVGTDHGYLPAYLAQKGLAQRVFASDISAASLNAAKRTAKESNITELITFLVAPGLDGISPADVDTVVIAGMGGETIVRILENAPWLKIKRKKLILQPQSKIDILFKFLYDTGYDIKEVKYVNEKRKRYLILHTEGTEQND